jgi:hypothetical protein
LRCGLRRPGITGVLLVLLLRIGLLCIGLLCWSGLAGRGLIRRRRRRRRLILPGPRWQGSHTKSQQENANRLHAHRPSPIKSSYCYSSMRWLFPCFELPSASGKAAKRYIACKQNQRHF